MSSSSPGGKGSGGQKEAASKKGKPSISNVGQKSGVEEDCQGETGGGPRRTKQGQGETGSRPPRGAERSGRSSLTERVGFFEQVWNRRQRSASKESSSSGTVVRRQGGQGVEDKDKVVRRERSATRVETAYHGKRADARDRSSEDPKRHRIPRASLSPSPVAVKADEDLDAEEVRTRIRTRSGSRKNMERRVSRERSLESERRKSREEGERERKRSREEAVRRSTSKEPSRQRDRSLSGNVDERLLDDSIPSQRTASVKRSLSGRSSYSSQRALSFRVSPAKGDEPRAIRSPERDTSISITRHIQSKVAQQRHSMTTYEKPPPLPERPPRANRSSEPAMYSSVSRDLSKEFSSSSTSKDNRLPTYMQSTASSLARSASRGSDYGQVNIRLAIISMNRWNGAANQPGALTKLTTFLSE